MTKSYSQTRLKKKSDSSAFDIVFLVLLSILFFYPPYLRGLYFNKEVLSTHLFSLILFGIYLILKGIKGEEIKFRTIFDYAIIGLIAAYILPLVLGQSANIRMAIGEILKYINYFIVFIIVSDICKDNKKLKVLLNVIVASGVGVAILGFDAASAGAANTDAIGNISKVINSIFSFFGSKSNTIFGGYVDGNINSTLQYKNACAAFLGAIFFVNIALLVETSRKWQKAIYGAAGFVMLTALILTGSRAMYLFFAVAFLVSIPLSPKGSKIDTILNNLFIDGVAVLFLGKITTKIADINNKPVGNNASKMWLLVLAGMLISAVLVYGISFIIKYVNKLSKKAYIAIFIAGVVAFGAIVAMAFSTTMPLALSPDKIATVQRNVDVTKGKYKIKLNIDVTKNDKKTLAWQVQVFSQTLQDMLSQSQGKSLYIKQGKDGQQLTISVDVPKKSKKLSIVLSNYNVGTLTNFNNLKVTNPDGNQKNIVLSYKFLPQSITDKIEDISSTSRNVIERGYFNKDAFKIIKDHPLVGAGGGAWGSGLYFKYQSYMYYTTQAHNFISQLTIETGVVGLLVYVVLLLGFAFAIYKYVIDIYKNDEQDEENKERNKLLTGVIVAAGLLIVHSFMDFDLSLAAVYLLLWELLAIVNSYISEKKFELFKLKDIELHRMGSAIALVVILIYVLMLKVGSYYSEAGATALKQNDSATARSMYEQALTADPLITSNSLQEASPKVNLATIYLSEYQTQVQSQNQSTTSKTQVQTQTVDPTLITKAKKKVDSAVYYEKNNPIVLMNAGVDYFYFRQGLSDIKKGLDLISKAVKAQPMNASNYEQKAAAYNAVGDMYSQVKKKNLAKTYYEKAIKVEDELKSANKRSVLEIVETEKTKTTIDKAKKALKAIK